MKKIGYHEILLTILTLCAIIYVCMDIYKYKRRIKQPQQINIENILDHQMIQYETEEDMNKFRDIIFNLDLTLQKFESRLDELDQRTATIREVE